MTAPRLSLDPRSPLELDVDVLVVGVGNGSALLGEGWSDDLAALPASIGFTGAVDDVRRIPAPAGVAAGSLAFVGLGGGTDTTALRNAAGAAARQLLGVESIGLALPATTPDEALAVLEGAALGAYVMPSWRKAERTAAQEPAARILVASSIENAALVERADAVGDAVRAVRDLVAAPPSHLYPETFVERVHELADGLPVEIEVLDEAALAEGGFGGILAVGAGSTRGPRLAVVRYSPEGARRHLALVGKGITFDSGGLSLKPAASMVGMKYDMTGAATVLGATLAAARLGLDVKVTAWLCLAENMPSGSAVRPNDVITVRGGTTVEVLNTDAEGRLVLADGLVAASEEQPDAIVDVATLTGAARVALGLRYAGIMGDKELVDRLVAIADDEGELLWPMPLPAELRPLISSDVADLVNARPGNTAAGMLLAGVFLREFIGGTDEARVPWAHLDIAGPATNDGGGYGYVGKGATGIAVRSLLGLADELSGAK